MDIKCKNFLNLNFKKALYYINRDVINTLNVVYSDRSYWWNNYCFSSVIDYQVMIIYIRKLCKICIFHKVLLL